MQLHQQTGKNSLFGLGLALSYQLKPMRGDYSPVEIAEGNLGYAAYLPAGEPKSPIGDFDGASIGLCRTVCSPTPILS
jgi:hypothetical protein